MSCSPFSKEEVQRYSRQLLVSDFGVEAQKGVRSSRVVIVGAGGLGCPVSIYLAGAGINTIGLVDYDEVSLDNLHRQVAHAEKAVGVKKTESLKESILRLNSTVNVICHDLLLNKTNALDVVKDYDIVVDCSDNAATRYLVNDACVLMNKPLVSGSALRWEGQLTTYHYDKDTPCYRCLFPTPPNSSFVTNCSEGGVLGPVVGIIGSMQALEVLRIAGGLKPSYAGRLFLFDGQRGSTRSVALRSRDTSCDVCGDTPSITELIDYEQFCGSGANDKIRSLKLLESNDRIRPEDYEKLRYTGSTPILIDTRPRHEFNIAHLPEAINVTLDEIRKLSQKPCQEFYERLGLNDDNRDVFVICHRGNDSQLAVQDLQKQFHSIQFKDIMGGYQLWAETIDRNFPQY